MEEGDFLPARTAHREEGILCCMKVHCRQACSLATEKENQSVPGFSKK